MPGHTRVVVVGVFVTLLWSSSWVLVRWGDARALDPIDFAASRYVLASTVLVGTVLARHRRAAAALLRAPGALRRVAVLGVTYYAVTQAAQFVAIVHQPAATTSLLLSATSFVVALLAFVVLG
ncbi:MAG: EamA family transporter, partial [Acidimicrobiia bacterium]|nr:EamA family transporter [Acidimicrobiia bacterium]